MSFLYSNLFPFDDYFGYIRINFHSITISNQFEIDFELIKSIIIFYKSDYVEKIDELITAKIEQYVNFIEYDQFFIEIDSTKKIDTFSNRFESINFRNISNTF